MPERIKIFEVEKLPENLKTGPAVISSFPLFKTGWSQSPAVGPKHRSHEEWHGLHFLLVIINKKRNGSMSPNFNFTKKSQFLTLTDQAQKPLKPLQRYHVYDRHSFLAHF